MTAFTYRAIWPIEDTELTRSELIVEACASLDVMAAADGARITGDPEWTIAGERLICEAPAVPLTDDPAEPGPETAADTERVRRDLEVLRLARLRWSAGQIAATTGVPKSTVLTVLARHGQRTAYAPGGKPRTDTGLVAA